MEIRRLITYMRDEEAYLKYHTERLAKTDPLFPIRFCFTIKTMSDSMSSIASVSINCQSFQVSLASFFQVHASPIVQVGIYQYPPMMRRICKLSPARTTAKLMMMVMLRRMRMWMEWRRRSQCSIY